MLSDLCRELNNWFVQAKYFCDFSIEDNHISPSEFIKPNQYFRIIGSTFNDGVYKNDDELVLTDEDFSGAIWVMNVPKEIIDLSGEIDAWVQKYGQVVDSPYQSESFGGYSYSKDANASKGWQSVFANRLNKWRKI